MFSFVHRITPPDLIDSVNDSSQHLVARLSSCLSIAWYQHHVSRLALMLALMCLAVATDPQFVPHPRFAQA